MAVIYKKNPPNVKFCTKLLTADNNGIAQRYFVNNLCIQGLWSTTATETTTTTQNTNTNDHTGSKSISILSPRITGKELDIKEGFNMLKC